MASAISPQADGAIRIYIGMAVAWAAAKGWIPGEWGPDITLFLVAIALSVWTIVANRLNNLLSVVAASPEVVKVVVADPLVAINHPSDKVVSEGVR